MKLKFLLVAILSLFLSACFEIESNVKIATTGEANIRIEFGMQSELLAMMDSPMFKGKNKKNESSPLEMFKMCGKPREELFQLPPGVRSFESELGRRDELVTCTIKIIVDDPLLAYTDFKKKNPEGDIRLEKLANVEGYRFYGKLGSPVSASSKDNPGDAMGEMLARAMFANRYLKIGIEGYRIENTNGKLDANTQRVSWKFPISSLMGMGTFVPITITADVIYRENWLAKWKRKLFQ